MRGFATIFAAFAFAAAHVGSAQDVCGDLASRGALGGAAIFSVTAVAADPSKHLPEFCDVRVTIAP